MKKILYGILILFLLLTVISVAVLNMPKADIHDTEVVASMTTEQLYNAFTSNETNANKKYLGKPVEVQGTIIDISKDEQGSNVLLLSTNAEPQVMVTLDKTQESIEKDQLGKSVKVKAQCNGMLMEVILSKGRIVN